MGTGAWTSLSCPPRPGLSSEAAPRQQCPKPSTRLASLRPPPGPPPGAPGVWRRCWLLRHLLAQLYPLLRRRRKASSAGPPPSKDGGRAKGVGALSLGQKPGPPTCRCRVGSQQTWVSPMLSAWLSPPIHLLSSSLGALPGQKWTEREPFRSTHRGGGLSTEKQAPWPGAWVQATPVPEANSGVSLPPPRQRGPGTPGSTCSFLWASGRRPVPLHRPLDNAPPPALRGRRPHGRCPGAEHRLQLREGRRGALPRATPGVRHTYRTRGSGSCRGPAPLPPCRVTPAVSLMRRVDAASRGPSSQAG